MVYNNEREKRTIVSISVSNVDSIVYFLIVEEKEVYISTEIICLLYSVS